FFYSSKRRHTRSRRDWSLDVCSFDLMKCSGRIKKKNGIRQKWKICGKIRRYAESNLSARKNHSGGFRNRKEQKQATYWRYVLMSVPGQNRDGNRWFTRKLWCRIR